MDKFSRNIREVKLRKIRESRERMGIAPLTVVGASKPAKKKPETIDDLTPKQLVKIALSLLEALCLNRVHPRKHRLPKETVSAWTHVLDNGGKDLMDLSYAEPCGANYHKQDEAAERFKKSLTDKGVEITLEQLD